MKPISLLSLTLFIYLVVSCRKKEQETTIKEDYREKYIGTYACLVKSHQRLNDSNQAYWYDTTYYKTVEIKKSIDINNLLITNYAISELSFGPEEPNFSGARTSGYFYSGDSLYINNSSSAYSIVYRGKKIK